MNDDPYAFDDDLSGGPSVAPAVSFDWAALEAGRPAGQPRPGPRKRSAKQAAALEHLQRSAAALAPVEAAAAVSGRGGSEDGGGREEDGAKVDAATGGEVEEMGGEEMVTGGEGGVAGSEGGPTRDEGGTTSSQAKAKVQRKSKSAFLAKPAPKKASLAAAVVKPATGQQQVVQPASGPAVLRPPPDVASQPAVAAKRRSDGSDALMHMVKAKRLAGLSVAQERAPATNVMEAQERGEELQAVDDAAYALDGLVGTCSSAVRQESAATLAAICTNRRGLGALKTEGLMPELLVSLHAALAKEDCAVALAAAAVVLGAAQPHADPMLLRMKEATQLIAQLLSCQAYLSPLDSKAASKEPVRKLRRILVEGPLSRQLPSAHAEAPAAVVLLALASATDPHNEQRVVDDELKEAFRTGGILVGAANLAVAVSASVPCVREAEGGQPDDSATRGLWALQHCMLVMEHTTFCCTPNVKFLSNLPVADVEGGNSAAKKKKFAVVAADVLSRLIAARDGWGNRVHPCLRATMAVLMNLTHSNAECAQTLATCGLCESVAGLLHALCFPSAAPEGASLRQGVVASLEVISLALGLLINLVEGAEQCKAQLLGWEGGGVLPLLTGLIKCSANQNAGVGGPEEEVTADDLELEEAEGEASIVEVYAAMLLGFLVAPDAELRSAAAGMLPGGTLLPVIAAVEKCLEFYTRTDTITESTSAKLGALIQSLRASS